MTSTTSEALLDFALKLENWVKAHCFDDDQDPGLDDPHQQLVRAYGRLVALAGGARTILDRLLIHMAPSAGSTVDDSLKRDEQP